MDEAERIHIETLLQTHHAVLRVLEQQQATLGIMTPPNIVVQIADYREKIADLEAQLRGPASSRKSAPRHNLPPRDYEHFVGRERELAELRRLLQPYPKSRAYVVTIDGIGGIGKSSLALETAHSLVDQYGALPIEERFDAIVWVSAKRTYLTASGILQRHQAFRALDDLYAAIAQVLDYPAITRARPEEQRVIVEGVLREHRTLLILDNLETVDDEDLLSFLRELPDPTKAIVTTRHRIDVAHPIRLTGMQHADALVLIAQEAARKDVSLAPDEQEQLWQRTGGLPLAIVWSIGLMGLGGSVESVLRRLGIVAGLGEDEFGRDMGLEELLRLSLVNKESERFSLLPLTRNYVRDEAAGQAEWMQATRERLQGYFYQLVKSSGGWSKDWQGQDQVERELPNIFAVIDSLVAGLRYRQTQEGNQVIDPESVPQAKKIGEFIHLVARTCRLRGYWGDWEKICRIGIDVAKTINESQRIGWYCLDLGKINYYRDNLSDATRWTRESHKEFQRSGRGYHVWADRQLGMILLRNGQVEQAAEVLTIAMNEYRQMGGEDGLYSFCGSMGELAEHQDDITTAMYWYQQAIDLLRQLNNIYSLSSDLLNMGRVVFASGDNSGARGWFDESLKLAHECGRQDVIAKALYRIAQLEKQSGQDNVAVSNTHQALDLFRRLGMKREQAETEALLAKLTQEAQNS